MAGFEPGSSVTQADAMSTAPRRQVQDLHMYLVFNSVFVLYVDLAFVGVCSCRPESPSLCRGRFFVGIFHFDFHIRKLGTKTIESGKLQKLNAQKIKRNLNQNRS
jgi:hypothetical protein